MTPEKTLDPSEIKDVVVENWTRTRAEERGFPDFVFPEGAWRVVVSYAIDKTGQIRQPKILEGVDEHRVAMEPAFKKQKINEVRASFGLPPLVV